MEVEKVKRIFILLLILLNSAVAFSKNIESETKYFNIIYDENLSEQVKEFILNADKNSEKVFEFYNFKPKTKYNIIFRDNSDSDNGVTEYDTIKLYFNEVPFLYDFQILGKLKQTSGSSEVSVPPLSQLNA